MPRPPRIAGLATALPPHRLDQEAVIERVKLLFAGAPDLDRLLPVFANSGIRARYSAMPLDWFDRAHGWPDRNRAYLAAALDLCTAAAGRALDRAGMAPEDIGAVVTVSSTGIATPSLDALLLERMALPRTAVRLPIFGLGCAGGALGLARAGAIAQTMPDRAVLLLVVELCTLQFRRDDFSRGNIVATALFSDGAAAALLTGGGSGPAIAASGEHTWPDSLGIMGWDVAADGLKAVFSRDIPRLVERELGPIVRDFLGRHGWALCDFERFVCHPGGPKVLDGFAAALNLPADALDDAREVLADCGNMSAASVMFVLERLLARRDAWRHALMSALGPGFSAGFVVLRQ